MKRQYSHGWHLGLVPGHLHLWLEALGVAKLPQHLLRSFLFLALGTGEEARGIEGHKGVSFLAACDVAVT